LHGVSAVRCDAVTGLLGNQRRRHHPAIIACFRQIAVEPGATRASLIDNDEVLGLGWHVPAELVEVDVPGADAAEIGHLGAVLLSDVSHGKRVFVDVQSNIECGSVMHG
jgi:hypothetical protein